MREMTLEEMRMVTGGAAGFSWSGAYKDPFYKEKYKDPFYTKENPDRDRYGPGPIDQVVYLLQTGNFGQAFGTAVANWPAMVGQAVDNMTHEPANGAWNCAKLGDCSGVKK